MSTDCMMSEDLEGKVDLDDLDDIEKRMVPCSFIFLDNNDENLNVFTGVLIGINVNNEQRVFEVETRVDVSAARAALKAVIDGSRAYESCLIKFNDKEQIILDLKESTGHRLLKVQIYDISDANNGFCCLLLSFKFQTLLLVDSYGHGQRTT